MDDVLEDLVPAWIRYLNKKHQTDIDPETIQKWEIHEYFPELSREEVFEPLFEANFWDTVKPKPGAVRFVKQLIDEGFTVYVCTNSHYKTLKFKLDKVLFKYFPYLTENQIITMKDKHLLKCNILVDDNPKNLINGDYNKILFAAPHNATERENKAFFIANNWEDCYVKIHECYMLDNCYEEYCLMNDFD